jgi:hypothetical protein
LAGLVSECIHRGVTDIWELVSEVSCVRDLDEISASDQALIGDHWNEVDVVAVTEILVPNWLKVELQAHFLVQHAPAAASC